MTTPRPYRQAMTPAQALNELRRSSHFDTALIDHLEVIINAQLVAALSLTVERASDMAVEESPST
jgi:HD-GYP domain-containing protein (c-di-GMP phosphodiesterase class II)